MSRKRINIITGEELPNNPRISKDMVFCEKETLNLLDDTKSNSIPRKIKSVLDNLKKDVYITWYYEDELEPPTQPVYDADGNLLHPSIATKPPLYTSFHPNMQYLFSEEILNHLAALINGIEDSYKFYETTAVLKDAFKIIDPILDSVNIELDK